MGRVGAGRAGAGRVGAGRVEAGWEGAGRAGRVGTALAQGWGSGGGWHVARFL